MNDGFLASGTVVTVNVKGDGPTTRQYQFTLLDDDGKERTFLLDTMSNPVRFQAMAGVVTAACASGMRLKVNIEQTPMPVEPATANEVEMEGPA